MAVMSSRSARAARLSQCEYDVARLASTEVDFDLSTDSWSQLHHPYMQARAAVLKTRAQTRPLELQDVLAQRFPFRHFIVTPRGRDAERLLFNTRAKPGASIIQNVLFHTARDQQIAHGMVPVEVPCDNAFSADAFPFKGNLDLDRAEWILKNQAVGLIFVEALSNGIGGHPVSIANLRALHALAQRYGVPLYLDATRALENCVLIRAHEPEFFRCDLAAILHAFLSCCDGVTLSLVKDFGVLQGGLLATHSDETLFRANAPKIESSDEEQAQLAQAIADWNYVESEVCARMQQAQRLGEGLHNLGFPVRLPLGGHCIILDLALLEAGSDQSAHSYLGWLYEQTGIRGARHWSACTAEYQQPLWIRLAVPLGFSARDTDTLLQLVGDTEHVALANRRS